MDLGGTGGVGELGGVSVIVGPGDTGDGRRNGLTGLTGGCIRRGVTGEFSAEFVSNWPSLSAGPDSLSNVLLERGRSKEGGVGYTRLGK